MVYLVTNFVIILAATKKKALGKRIVWFLLFICPLMVYSQNAGDVISENNVVRDTSRQTDLIDIAKQVLNIKSQTIEEEKNKKVYFSVLPLSTEVPGGGTALITATTAGFYLGDRDSTYLSTATFTPYWNFKERFGLPLRTNIWLKNNSWNIKGDTRFMVYPQYTWGLGSVHSSSDKIMVDYNYIRFYQSALKRFKPYFYAGIGYNLDYFQNIRTDGTSLRDFTSYEYGTDGPNSFSSGITLNLLYDTRNNEFNPIPGSYANISYRVNSTFLGSNSTWRSLYIDLRKYISMSERSSEHNVLAFWSYFWTVLDTGAPYLNLPAIGMDPSNRSGRGLEHNRYRGRSLLYLESEYRRDLTRNGLFGFVVFASVNALTEENNRFESVNPALGAGLRVKFNKGSQTNIALDYGFSKGYSGISVSLGEAF